MEPSPPKPRFWPLAAALAIIGAGSVILFLAVRAQQDSGVSAVADIPPWGGRPGEEAAYVGGAPIYVSDIEREAAAQGLVAPGELLFPGDPVYERVLGELVDQTLLAREAEARRMDSAPETRRRLETARQRILGNVLLESAVNEAVTDEAIRRMYDEQVRLVEMGDEVRARHILLATREEAEEVRQRLEDGEDFAALAFELSLDEPTRLQGGDLGYFTSDTVLAPLAAAAYATPVGELSAPVESRFGWHVVLVEGRRASPRPDFETLRPRIVRFMVFDAIQQLLARLRETTPVEIVEPRLAPRDPDSPDPMAEFFNALPPNPAAGMDALAADARDAFPALRPAPDGAPVPAPAPDGATP